MSPDNRGPRVSIILPAGNRADGLPAAMWSILHQTYTDFELIIVDYGSADTAPELLAGRTDPRVAVIRIPEMHGIACAWNAGLGAARGEFVGFVSSGDAWDERKLEEQVACFSVLSPDYGVVCSDSWEITRAGTRAYWHAPDMTGPDLLNSYATGFLAGTLGTGPILVRRSCLDQAGPFDEQVRCFSDTDMIIRLQRVCRFHHIRKPLYLCRSRQEYEGNPFERSISQVLLMQKYPEALRNPVFLTHQVDLIARNLRQAGESGHSASGQVPPGPEQGHFREPVPCP